MNQDLTTNQRNILSFVRDYIAKNQYPPSYREISDGNGGISLNTVKQCMDALCLAGAIEKPQGRIAARSIRITAIGKSLAKR